MFKDQITIQELQKYIKDKDYKPELQHAYFLKLVEEVGELSEAIRKGQRMDGKKIKGTIEEELFDVLYYILALANIYEVDLEECCRLKEELNRQKYHTNIIESPSS